jgi:hypothetical protein
MSRFYLRNRLLKAIIIEFLLVVSSTTLPRAEQMSVVALKHEWIRVNKLCRKGSAEDAATIVACIERGVVRRRLIEAGCVFRTEDILHAYWDCGGRQ